MALYVRTIKNCDALAGFTQSCLCERFGVSDVIEVQIELLAVNSRSPADMLGFELNFTPRYRNLLLLL